MVGLGVVHEPDAVDQLPANAEAPGVEVEVVAVEAVHLASAHACHGGEVNWSEKRILGHRQVGEETTEFFGRPEPHLRGPRRFGGGSSRVGGRILVDQLLAPGVAKGLADDCGV